MNFPLKILMVLVLLALPYMLAQSEEKRLYQKDSFGNIQYNKPSYTIQNNGRIFETDTMGNKQYQKQQYQIKGDKVYSTDIYGNIQYNKPQFVIDNKSK